VTTPTQRLVLIHGALGAGPQLDPLRAQLGAEHRIEVLELEGHGSTPSSAASYSMPRFVAQLRAFIESKGLAPTAIFGYSMGGYVALLLAGERPDLVSRVVTLGTKLAWTPQGAAKETSRLDPAKIREKVPKFAEQLEARHRGAGGWESVLSRTAVLMSELGAQPLVTSSVLARITQPLRLMVGNKDTVVSADETREAANVAANGEFVLLPDTPHPFEQVNAHLLAERIRDFI
jgi:pimeloyl-ACP methyl ester carboxylesterase